MRLWLRGASLIKRLVVVFLFLGLSSLLMGTTAKSAQEDVGSRPNVLQEVPATAMDLRTPRAQNSPMLAADPTNASFVVLAHRLDGPDFGCALQVSGNGGRGWIPVDPVPHLPPGAEKCYAPEIAFDRDGVLYYLFVGLHGRGNEPMGVFLTTSSDRARSFSTPWMVLGPENYQVRMAIDPTIGSAGRIHLVWLRVTQDAPLGGLPPPPNPIMSAYSDDGGKTFSQPVQVNDPERELSVAPALAVGPDHRVHVLYYDLQDDTRDYHGLEGPTWEGRWSLVSTTSPDGGRQFERGVLVDDGLVPPGRVMLIFTMPPPALVADQQGRVFASWYDARNGDWDVFLSRSTTGGGSWSPPMRVNDDSLGNGRHQYLPRLSTAPGDRVDLIFYDRRRDPENVRNDVFYTFSTDGGRAFASNSRLTSEPSHSRTGQQYLIPSAQGLVEFGSRTALLSNGSAALAAWTDTRYTAGSWVQQDIFTTEVLLPPQPGTAGWQRWALIATVLLAIALIAIRRVTRARASRAPLIPEGSLLVAISVIGVLLLVSCAPREAELLPPAPPVEDIIMREYQFEHAPVFPPGRVVVRTRNVGAQQHSLSLVMLPEDFPPIDEQLRSETRRGVPTVAYLPSRQPDTTAIFALDLAPGRYALICFVTDADGVQHAEKGMSSEFQVR